MKKIVYPILVLLPFLFFVLYVGIENKQVTTFNFLQMEWNTSVGKLVIVSIAFGLILGGIIAILSSFKAKMQLRKLRKQLQKSDQEVQNLRALPIKDEV